MRSADEPKSNVQRFIEVFKKIRKQGFGTKPLPNIRPSEMMMLHSILYSLCKRQKAETDLGNDPSSVIGVTISELSESTQMTPSAVSQLMKALEEKELIRRTVNQSDRRIVYVNISEQGQRVVQEAERLWFERLDRITEALGEEDANQLITLLEKLADIIAALKKADEASDSKESQNSGNNTL